MQSTALNSKKLNENSTATDMNFSGVKAVWKLCMGDGPVGILFWRCVRVQPFWRCHMFGHLIFVWTKLQLMQLTCNWLQIFQKAWFDSTTYHWQAFRNFISRLAPFPCSCFCLLCIKVRGKSEFCKRKYSALIETSDSVSSNALLHLKFHTTAEQASSKKLPETRSCDES